MKLLQQVQSEALQPGPGLKASFALPHMQASECATFPSKIQRWLNRRDYLRRFLKQKVEIDLCLKASKSYQTHLAEGRHPDSENSRITGKHRLDGSQSKPRMRGPR